MSEGIVASGDERTLADDDLPRSGPLVKPVGVGGLAAVVWCQENVRAWVRGMAVDQFVEPELLEITRQEQMAPAEGDVEHETACVVRRLRVPPGRRVPHRELDA